jgi:hypothetical protein
MLTIKRVARHLGPLTWSRDQWLLLLVDVRGRVFGFYLDRIRLELVLIVGCRLIERSALGKPRLLTGGIHLRFPLSLRLRRPNRLDLKA